MMKQDIELLKNILISIEELQQRAMRRGTEREFP